MRVFSRMSFVVLLATGGITSAQESILDFSLVDVPNEQVVSVTATTVVNGLTALDLTRGPGLNPFNLTRGYSAQGWITGLEPGIPASRETAIEYGEYFQFGFSVNADATASLSSLDISLRRSALAAPSNLEWQYSLDGFATAGVTISDPLSPWYSGGVFTYLGRNSGSGGVADNYNYMTVDVSAQGAGNPMPPLDLSGITALQSITGGSNVTFRLYAWGNGTGTDTNTLAIGRDYGPKLTGTVVAPPPPSSSLTWAADGIAAGGSGTWNDSGVTWLGAGGSPGAWSATSTAIFNGTAGTVTVETAISADNGLSFESDGFLISNGTLTLGGADAASNTITVAASTTARIDSLLAGTAGLTKTGAGRLVLGGANLISGPLTISGGTIEVTRSGGLGTTDLTVGGGAQLAVVQDARVTAAVRSLAVDEAAAGGRVDLGAGALTVAAGGISAADLRADIIAGRNGGAWNGGTGITSSRAASSGGTRAVGYVVNGDGSSQVSFAAAGDVDLSGAVNVFDLVSINSSGKYGTGASSVWNQGDFNYDGVTNVFDLVGVNTAGVYGQGNYFPAAPSVAGIGGPTAVPEPVSWILVAAGGAVLAACRRGVSCRATVVVDTVRGCRKILPRKGP